MTDTAPEARSPRAWWRAAFAPFAWLAFAILVASALAFAALAIVPELTPGDRALGSWNPLWSAVELQVVGADADAVAAFVEVAAESFASRVVEQREEDGARWIVVVGAGNAGALVREVSDLMRAQGLEPGPFTMGSNLARVSAALIENPAAATEAAAVLLPLVLMLGSGALLVIGLFLRRRLGQERSADMPKRSCGRRVGLGIVVGLLLAALIEGVGAVLARLGAPIVEQPWLTEVFDAGGARQWLVCAAVVLLAPLAEEAFFRGYLLPALVRPWGELGAIALSSLAFAAIHGHVPALPAYLVYGVGLAIAARRTGSLVTPVVAHMTVNALAVGVVLWGG